MSSAGRRNICLCVVGGVVFIFIIVMSVTTHEKGQETKNDTLYCLLKSGGIGVCLNFHNCNLTNLAQEGKNPAMCESETDDVIVCCPTQTPLPFLINTFRINNKSRNNVNTINTSQRSTLEPTINRMQPIMSKSSQKCMEYSKIKCANSTSTSTIINGVKVESVESYPHMAHLGYGDTEKPDNLTWQCGGTLISEQYVLTAAHCLLGYDRTEPVVAHLGFLNKKNPNQFNTFQEFKIVEKIKHPDRIDPRTYADIALLKLDRPVILSKSVLPACLYESMDFPRKTAQATGWGDIVSGSNLGSDHLMKVTLPILKYDNCFSLYPKFRNMPEGIKEDQQFCAGEPNKDTCQGDSGGPLQIIGEDYCMHYIIGITSFGNNCGLQSGVYTRVSHYVPWIESIVWP